MFRLVGVAGAEPCMRCLLDRDPVVRRHLARINRYRGEYDEWGNRLTRYAGKTFPSINISEEINENIYVLLRNFTLHKIHNVIILFQKPTFFIVW